MSPNQAAKPLGRLNIPAGGRGAAKAAAITGLPVTGASSNFGMPSFGAPHRRGDNLGAGAYNVAQCSARFCAASRFMQSFAATS